MESILLRNLLRLGQRLHSTLASLCEAPGRTGGRKGLRNWNGRELTGERNSITLHAAPKGCPVYRHRKGRSRAWAAHREKDSC